MTEEYDCRIRESADGSGKTALLSFIGCILSSPRGCVCIQGVNTKDLNERYLARLRLTQMGIVFQNFNLKVPLNAEENIQIPSAFSGPESRDIQGVNKL